MTETELRDRAIDLAYREHAPDVYRVAFGILRDADEALDATQDAFARAWERWEQYDSHRPLRAWLHGIAVHLCLDRLRRRRVREVAVANVARADTGSRFGSVPDLAPGVASRALVDSALGSLKPEARAVLVLRHYYGYDYAAIAAFLGTTSGNVGSILTRSHAALRERLSLETGEEGTARRSTPRPVASPAVPTHPRSPLSSSPTEPPEVQP